MGEFTSEPGSAIRVRLEEHEADVLRNLILEMRTMLESGNSGDPVMERLYPRAYDSLPEEDAYRELVGSDLERAKKNALDKIAVSIGEKGGVDVPLSNDEAEAWLTGLTDIRLAIGTRIDVTEEMMREDLDPNDPRAPALAVLHWLGWVQETMIERLESRE